MKNVKIVFIGGGNMGGAMMEALWRAQPDEANSGRNSAEDERKFDAGSEARGADCLGGFAMTPSVRPWKERRV